MICMYYVYVMCVLCMMCVLCIFYYYVQCNTVTAARRVLSLRVQINFVQQAEDTNI